MLKWQWNALTVRAGYSALAAGMLLGPCSADAAGPGAGQNAHYQNQGTPFQNAENRLNQFFLTSLSDEAPPAAPPADGVTAPDEAPPACEEPTAPEGPWTLTEYFTCSCGGNFLKEHNIRLFGNMAQSFTFNFQGPTDKFNGPVTWTDRSNEYQLNQLWLGVEKATDTSKSDVDWGGRFDMNYGTNSRLLTQSGFEPHGYYGNSFYGLAYPNAYIDAAYQKLKIRVGRWVSPIGYFTANTVDNFFNTIPYTYQWGEPFTITGAKGIYQVSDNLVVSGGVIRGWDNFDNHNPHLGFEGTWSYTFADKSNLSHVFYWSQEPNANFTFSQRYYQSLVYSRTLTENLNYVGETDLGVQQDALVSGKTAYWYGLNQYVFYTINERLTVGFNFEWWRDEEGYRVAGFLPSDLPSGITSDARGFPTNRFGYMGNFYQITFGPKWYPTSSKNLFIRPNFRFDWFQGDVTNPDGLKPYDDGTKDWQSLFVTDVVLLF